MVLNQIRDEVDVKPKNNQIEEQELLDAMKPNGFLSKEENIRKVGELLNDNNIDGEDEKLLNSLEQSFSNLKSNILSQHKLSNEDKTILEVYKKLLGSRDSEGIRKINEFIAYHDKLDRENDLILNRINELDEQYQTILYNFLAKYSGPGTVPDKIDECLDAAIDVDMENDINAIIVMCSILRNCNDRREKLKKKIEQGVMNMMNNINKIIARNDERHANNPLLNYSTEQVKLIQLWATVVCGENLKIDGKRNGVYGVSSDNGGITNIYIYKLELQTRGDMMSFRQSMNMKLYNDLLKIPNLNKKFEGLSQEVQNAIMTEFLKFFFEIKRPGMKFENMIGCEDLESVLDNLILAEKKKDMPMDDFINEYKLNYILHYKFKLGKDVTAEELGSLEQKIKEYESPRSYLRAVAYLQMDGIKINNGINIDRDNILLYTTYIGQLQKIGESNNWTATSKVDEIMNRMIMLGDYGKLPSDIQDAVSLLMNRFYRKGDIRSGKLVLNSQPEGYNQHEADLFNMFLYYKQDRNAVQEIESSLSSDGRIRSVIQDYRSQKERLKNLSYQQKKEDPSWYDGELVVWKDTDPINKSTKVQCGLAKFDDEGNLRIYRIHRSAEGHRARAFTYGKETLTIPKKLLAQFEKYYKVTSNLDNYIENTNREYNKYESDIDIMSQYNSKDNFSIERKLGTVYKLHIPGCAELDINCFESSAQAMQKLFREAKNDPTKKIVMLPNCTNFNNYEKCFAYVKKDAKGNLNLYDIKTPNKLIKTISKATQDMVGQLQDKSVQILECPGMRRLRDVTNTEGNVLELSNEMGSLLEKMDSAKINRGNMLLYGGIHSNPITAGVYHIFGGNLELSSGGINAAESDRIREIAVQMKQMKNGIVKNITAWKDLQKDLMRIKGDRSGNNISNDVEKYIDSLYGAVTQLLTLVEDGVIDKWYEQAINLKNFRANDTAFLQIWNWLKDNGIKILCAIGFAVALICAIPSGGSSLAAVAVLGTVGGMIGSRVGQYVNEKLNNIPTKTIEVNGKPFTFRYDDPTDVELFLKGKMGAGDFFGGLTAEFAIGVATTFTFMKVGSWIGEGLAKTHPTAARIIRPKAFKFDEAQYADDMFNQVAKNGGQKGFLQRFGKEFFEECREETGETTFEMIGDKTGIPMIGAIASIYHCITPGPNISLLSKNKTSFGGAQINGDNIDIELNYEPIVEQGVDTGFKSLKKYYEAGGYTYNANDGTFSKQNEEYQNRKPPFTNVIHLRQTNASIEARNFANSDAGRAGGVTVDHDSGRLYYDQSSFRHLVTYAEYNGLGTIKIDANDVVTIVTKDNVELKLYPNNKSNISVQDMKKSDIIDLINGKSAIRLTNLNANDMRLLMYKASNMGLSLEAIENLGESIYQSLEGNLNINPDAKTDLQNYVNYFRYIARIENINIEGDLSQIESNLNNIKQQIDTDFGENSIMAKELNIEINKKKFELYKAMGNIDQAQTMINEIQKSNTELLSNDYNNFKYRRGLLEANLLQIQLGGEIGQTALDGLNEKAQEMWDKTETIGGRTDTETLISKIESGILLGKSETELQPYLDFLALAEHGAGINILGAVIQTINTTFDSDGAKGILKKYAADVTDAGTASNNADLLKAGEKAKTISDTYEQMRNNLDNDSNGIYSNEIKMRLEKFVKERNVSSILDFGNNFSHPTILLNPQATRTSPVMSIEIGDADYQAARSILENEIKVNLDGNRNNFSELMQNFNQSVDKWIRETYGTANLQELNSSEHRALFDYIAARFMEGRRGSVEASLTNLSQLFGVKGLQDCRLHAFTKQLFFDTWKMSQLESLERSKTGEKTPMEISEINKKIKLIENTNMIFLDASFSGNVDMNNMYVARTENGYMMTGNQNNVIEEHTFNLIEMPVLDAEGNLQYEDVLDDAGKPTGAKKIKRIVCFADSFYQGIIENGVNTGKIYDLSFTGENIGNLIYGNHGNDIHLKATVTDVNGNPIEIRVTPLGWSIQGRGDNITGSSIETRGPTDDERGELSERYTYNSEKADEIRYNRMAIQGRLNEQLSNLKQGEPVNLEDAIKIGDHAVVEWQATQIKKAFELYGRVPNTEQGKAIAAIEMMISNTVTQNAVDFAGDLGGATEFLQTEGVFFEAMQVFNDVYKAEIIETLNQLDPNNLDSIQRLQNAIKTYQEIFTNDMGSFFEISQKAALKDGKRGTEYHRNNFEKVAKRFQSDMVVYSEVVKELESVGLFEQAYEMREYMVAQEAILLEHSDKLLGDMIDFKKVKKEMKGLQGRELYNQLKGIQGKNTRDIILEFQRKGLDRNKIKDMTGMDANAELTQESLNQVIANIEESGLKEYYDIIGLVFNPEILAIQMENAVYSRGGYSISEGGEILFNTETKEDYIARKQAEYEVSRQLNDNMTSGEISQIIYDQILKNLDPSLLAGNAKINIQTEIQNLVDLCSQCGITGQQAYNIGKTATEALIFQTTESQTRIMGDHGINHISGNIAKLNTYLDAGVKGGKIPSGEVGKYKLMGALTHIFHDVGYAATISKGSGSFDGSAIHPFTSKVFFDANIKGLLGNSGINTELISKAIEAHDGIRLNFSTPEATFLSFVNLSDNMALGVDKMAQVWSNPKLLNHISTLYALDKAGIDIKEANNRIIQNIRQDNSISQAEQETLISAISELSGRGLDNIDFWSISPFTAMEFTGNTPTLSMFKGANLMLVAEVCGIDTVQLQEAINSRNRDAVINLIKGRKFGSQIIKPLGDYCDIYSIHDANGNEYPKVEKKKDGKTYMEYDWDNIKADLLLGNTVMLKDGDNLVLNYKYENSTDVSRQAEQNSVYGNINTADMLRQGVETMKTLNTSAVIQELGSLNQTTKKILDNIKEKKSIDTNEAISTIEETISNINISITASDVTVNQEFKEYFESFKLKSELLITNLKENNYADIKPVAENIQEGINILSSFLVQE